MLTLTASLLQAQGKDPAPTGKTSTMWGTYYADFFVGRKTSCGDIFRQNQYTAAHRTIPCGTYLMVYNPYSGLRVVVRVNDRCPRHNVLDMTKLAVHTLGIKGARRVEVTFLDEETGYRLWAAQDTLAMSEAEYLAYKDRSRVRRITPYGPPLTPPTRSSVTSTRTPTAPPGALPETEDSIDNTETELDVPRPVVVQSQPAVIISTHHTPTDTTIEETAPAKNRRYDIELCVVGSHKAAMKALSRLPKDLQKKATLEYNPPDKQVRVTLTIAATRSHAVRTQELLLEDFPDSYLFLHKDPRKASKKE